MIHLSSFGAAALLLAVAAASGCDGAPTPPPLAESVTVTAPATSLVAGDSLRLAAAVRDGSGRAIERPVTWSSSSNAVATVSPAGTVTAVSAGAVTITATADGKNGTVELSVAAAVGALTVTVETVGDLPDPDGYEITRNGEPIGRVGINGSLQLQDLEVGSYSIGLRDASLYCGIEGDSVRSAAVQRGATTTVAFRVECLRNGIAYQTFADRRASLWVHFPGRAPHLLVSGIANSAVDWSPDGRRIAFAGSAGFPDLPGIGSGIYTIDLDSLEIRRISSRNATTPVWSRDGSAIAYTAYDFNCCGSLVTVSPDGTNDRVIWQSDANVITATTPAWSPDGSEIAFRRAHVTTSKTEIVVVNRNGSALRVVRELRANAGGLAWSPDGSRFLYGDQPVGTPIRLYTADAVTGLETLLYQKSGEHVLSGSYVRGGRIGFLSRVANTTSGEFTGIWTIRTDGSDLTAHPLPASVVNPLLPAWQ